MSHEAIQEWILTVFHADTGGTDSTQPAIGMALCKGCDLKNCSEMDLTDIVLIDLFAVMQKETEQKRTSS